MLVECGRCEPLTCWKDSCVAFPVFSCFVPAAMDSGVSLGAEELAFLSDRAPAVLLTVV